jgi:hypothetical protein
MRLHKLLQNLQAVWQGRDHVTIGCDSMYFPCGVGTHADSYGISREGGISYPYLLNGGIGNSGCRAMCKR